MTEIEQIEATIQEHKANIEKLEALERLRKNRDYIDLFEQGYLKDESARVVWSLAEPNLQGEEIQKQLHGMLYAIGYFRQYLSKIYQFGNQAKMSITEHENTRNELMSEGE